MDALRIVLADDHTMVRAGLRALLEAIPGVSVVGETGDGGEALALALELRPDVVLLDVAMPTMSGLEAAARIGRELPDTRVIILSMHSADQYVVQALRAGVSGYLLKNGAVKELEHALQAVARGERYLSAALSRHVLETFIERAAEAEPTLTGRQTEVLRLIAQGRNTKGIADELGLSAKTVEAHRAQIMERLGVHDIASLVRYAMRAGIVPPEV